MLKVFPGSLSTGHQKCTLEASMSNVLTSRPSCLRSLSIIMFGWVHDGWIWVPCEWRQTHNNNNNNKGALHELAFGPQQFWYYFAALAFFVSFFCLHIKAHTIFFFFFFTPYADICSAVMSWIFRLDFCTFAGNEDAVAMWTKKKMSITRNNNGLPP